MPFEIIRSDITAVKADAIVNTVYPEPLIGSGVDSAINAKAGAELFEARRKIGRIDVGDAAVTPAFGLDARYVIHTAAPCWQGGKENEEFLLGRCYRRCLDLAAENDCRSVAFPLLSAGNYRFPKELALRIAVREISEFPGIRDIQVYLVVFGSQEFNVSIRLFNSVRCYIDDNYVEEKLAEEQKFPDARWLSKRGDTSVFGRSGSLFRMKDPAVHSVQPMSMSMAEMPDKGDLDKLLSGLDAGFSETLLKLIDRTGKKDSEIYKKAGVDRKLFSKIRNNPDYKPSKPTAIAFAFALELNIDETKDLISRAGYALSHSSKFDMIVEYFLMNSIYNIMELNEVLYAFDQPLVS